MEWYQYIINAIIVIIGRALDIISTRYVTKELKLETNKLARRLGWKGAIFLQIPLIILGCLDFYFALFIFFWSLFLFANNIEGSWYIKEVGEENYKEEIKSHLKNSKTWKIIVGETSHIFTFSLSGLLILVFLFVLEDIMAVIFICIALICQGGLSTFRSIQFLVSLKKENQVNRKKEEK
ncbi:MAG: hypothetical protein EU539_07990 [Promethearchaeota archaeon]|nr:MAG: hypothetical protein EU539_07990 [Candidatus Lokiarchaeota archaeon]